MNLLNFDKVQKEFLQDALKRSHDSRRACCWIYSRNDSKKEIILSDGYTCFFIPQEMCFVTAMPDTGIRVVEPEQFEKMLKNMPDNLERLTDTQTIKTTAITGKIQIHVLKTKDGQEIWINQKYYDRFSGMDNVQFYGAGGKNPIKVLVYDRLVGILLPITH